MKNALQPIEPGDIVNLQHIDRETLAAQLKLFVIDLLGHDFSRLCALMYRHDVNERLFNEALGLPNDDARAEEIARLIIDRELMKIKTRALYSKDKNRNRLED